MEKILVSSCLLGEPVRYNGADKRCDHDLLRRWVEEGRVIAVCPEIAGGLPVPRPPAEIAYGAGGTAVLEGRAKVIDVEGRDVSSSFVLGADAALAAALTHGIRVAVLKEGSPSCGTGYIYDGTFTSTRVREEGVTAARLRKAGLHVFNESRLAEADFLLHEFEMDDGE